MNPSIVEIAAKSSVIIALAAAVVGVMRRRGSAASRHLVWTLAVAGLLVLPLASSVLPAWSIALSSARRRRLLSSKRRKCRRHQPWRRN